jgi:hypothetical protein
VVSDFRSLLLISAAWADSPLISIKRWIRCSATGHGFLVLFSEPDPEEALTRMMKRCAYLVFPISILWINTIPPWVDSSELTEPLRTPG